MNRGGLDLSEEVEVSHLPSEFAGRQDLSPGKGEQEASLRDRIPVALMDGDELVSLLVELHIGVTRENPDLLELAELDADPA